MPYQNQVTWESLKKILLRGVEMPEQRPLLWVGTELSIAAGFPSNIQIVEHLQKASSEALPLFNPESKNSSFNSPESSFSKWIQVFVERNGNRLLIGGLQTCLDGKTIAPTEIHRNLLRLPWKAVLTTNYDQLLEDTLKEIDYSYQRVTLEQNLGLYPSTQTLIKIHGSIEEFSNLISVEKSYFPFIGKNPYLNAGLTSLLFRHSVVYYGVNREDPRLFEWFQSCVKKGVNQQLKYSVVFIQKQEWESFSNEYRDLLSQCNIHPLFFNEIEEIRDMLKGWESEFPLVPFSNEFKEIRLKKLKIHNLKCFKTLEIKFGDHLNPIVIIGTNAKGKSTLLQALSLLLNESSTVPFPFSWNQVVRKGEEQGQLELDLEIGGQSYSIKAEIGMDDQLQWIGKEPQLNDQKKHFVFCAYGANRHVKLEDPKPYPDFEPIATLFGENGYLKHIKSSETNDQVKLYFSPLQDLINAILAKADPVNPTLLVSFDVKSAYFQTYSNSKELVPLEALSEGLKSTFVWVFDACLRILEQGGKLENSKDLTGVILIDELDLHLHPSWQRSILRSLTEVFPKIQFVVTTHSPFIVQAARESSVFLLKSDTERESVRVEPKELSRELSYEEIVRNTFEVPSLFSSRVEKFFTQFRKMKGRLQKGEKMDEEEFRKLVVQIAETGAEPEAIIRAEVFQLERQLNRSFGLWSKE